MLRRPTVACLALALLLAAPRARADSSPEDRAAADALYEEAGKLMKAKRWADACPKLEASLKLDPGIGTSLRLGFCFEQIGRTASAWSAYNDAEGMARKAGDRRADEAAKLAKRIEPRLSRFVLEVATEGRAGLEIKRDGRAIDPAAWASPIPIDPGSHAIEASQPGKKPWTTTITIETKPGVTNVRVPALEDLPPEQPPPKVARDEAPPPPFWGSQRIAGVAVGGAGVAGLAVGSILGGLALGKASSLKSGGHCNADLSVCDAAGLSLRKSAQTMAHGSTAALAIGGAALAAGVIVFATAPSGRGPAASGARVTIGPIAGVEMTGVLVRGGF